MSFIRWMAGRIIYLVWVHTEEFWGEYSEVGVNSTLAVFSEMDLGEVKFNQELDSVMNKGGLCNWVYLVSGYSKVGLGHHG